MKKILVATIKPFAEKAIKEMSLFEKMVDHLGKIVLTHPKYVFSAGIILVVFGLFGFHKISIDVNFAEQSHILTL